MKERNVLLKTHSTRFIYGYTVEEHSDGLPFPISSKGSFICTYHGLCYTSGETPAEKGEIAQWVHHKYSIRQSIPP